jgi:epoxyqueuosine reductase
MVPEKTRLLSSHIREKAIELGFDICGIAKVRTLAENGAILKKWCEAGMNDKMQYLERDFEKRINPQLHLPGAKSIIVTGFSYNSPSGQKDPDAPILSRYTYGNDYHDVIKEKLTLLLDFTKSNIPGCEGKIFVDSGTMMDKAWAVEAGLGWQGKHSIMINREIGSFFFIGELILNISLDYDIKMESDPCGTCRKCIDECPTGAINENRTIDARKCIANLTIENRGPIPEEIIPKLGKRVYGCDRCQEVCPWNQNARPNKHPELKMSDEVASMTRSEWLSISPGTFNRLFGRTAMSRVKYEQFIQNVRLVLK